MRYIRRLKYTLLFKCVFNQAFIYVILIALFLISIHHKNVGIGIVCLGYWIYLLKKSPKCALYASFIIAILFINYMVRTNHFLNLYQSNYKGVAKIEKVKKVNDNYQVKIKLDKGYVLYYSETRLTVGEIFYIEGQITPFYKNHYPGGFNYYQYASYQYIFGSISIDKMVYQKQSFSKYYLNDLVDQYYEQHFHSDAVGMIKALTIGNKDVFDKELNTSISNIGISHLFVISGLHVNLIALFLSKILSIFQKKIPKQFQEGIIIGCLFIYYVVSGFLISVFRVVFGYVLKFINEQFAFRISTFHLLSIQIILILMYNPFYAFQYSFLLSYVISASIIMCNQFLKKMKNLKNKITNQIKISLLSISITLPIVVNIHPDVNLLAVVYNLFYIPIVSYLILPLAFLTSVIIPLENAFLFVYEIFKNITLFLGKIDILTITYPMVPLEFILCYYFIIYFYLRRKEEGKKGFLFFILFLGINLVWINISTLNPRQEVFFLDLPKGEATLIKEAYNRKNILIDTGEKGYEDIIIFLKKQGIKRIDVILISHGDSDHNGMLKELINEFHVKEVWFSQYDQTTRILSSSVKQKILYANQNIRIGKNINLSILSPTKDYGSSNENSLVILAHIFNCRYLFTGDIENIAEKDLPYIGKIDYLKVPHHGSNTSSSSELLKKINYKYAVCMNGYKNSFSFPHAITEEKYRDKLYITSKRGTLVIKSK